MPWKAPIGLPNCSRVTAYDDAVSSAQPASPVASAATTVPTSTSTRSVVSPGSTREAGTATSSSTTVAGRRVASRPVSVVMVAWSASRTNHVSPAPSSSRSARPPPTTRSTVPLTRNPSSVGVATRSAVTATAAVVVPSTRPGRSSLAGVPPACDSSSDARTVGRLGPWAKARESSSTVTASSTPPAPDPPDSSATCSPSRPCPARAPHQDGRPCSPSSEARAVARTPARSAQPRTEDARASWSSFTPIVICTCPSVGVLAY